MDFANSRAKGGLAAALIVWAATGGGGDAVGQTPYSDGDWLVSVNAARVLTEESLDSITAGGAPIPGAGVAITDDTTLSFEATHFLSSSLAVNFFGGFPATAILSGRGSIAALPIGETKYGPAILSLQYHMPTGDRFSPYVGVGVGRVVFLDERDGAVIGLGLEDAWAPALQAGFRYRLNENWLANLDVRYAPFKADLIGSLAGARVSATVDVEPVIVNMGVAYRF